MITARIDTPMPSLAGYASPPDTWGKASDALASKLFGAITAAGEFLSPTSRAVGYQANASNPNKIPDLDAAIEMWGSDQINDLNLRLIGYAHGVYFNKPQIAYNLYVRRDNLLLFNEKTLEVPHNIWDQQLINRQWVPSLAELLQLLNRGLVSDDVADFWLSRIGMVDSRVRDTVRTLRYEIPGPSELAHFAVRHVFDPQEFREKLGIEEEYPDSFAFWANRQGLGKITLTDPETKETRTADWARAHWEAHWVYPSPTQLYEMFRRLRSSRIERIQEDFRQRLKNDVDVFDKTAGKQGISQADADKFVGALQPFTYTDLLAGLRANDYAPVWRPRLAAIEFVQPTRVDIRRMYQLGVENGGIDAQEVRELYQDRGYSPTNAARLTAITIGAQSRNAAQAIIRETKAHITHAYQLGIISDTESLTLLRQHGLNDAQAAQALKNIQLDLRISHIDRAVKVTRSRFLHAHISQIEASAELAKLDLQPARVTDMLEEWAIELTGRRRDLTTAQILKLLKNGAILEGDAVQRLKNLGYNSTDVGLLIRGLPAKKEQKNGQPRAAGAIPIPEAAAPLAPAP